MDHSTRWCAALFYTSVYKGRKDNTDRVFKRGLRSDCEEDDSDVQTGLWKEKSVGIDKGLSNLDMLQWKQWWMSLDSAVIMKQKIITAETAAWKESLLS